MASDLFTYKLPQQNLQKFEQYFYNPSFSGVSPGVSSGALVENSNVIPQNIIPNLPQYDPNMIPPYDPNMIPQYDPNLPQYDPNSQPYFQNFNEIDQKKKRTTMKIIIGVVVILAIVVIAILIIVFVFGGSSDNGGGGDGGGGGQKNTNPQTLNPNDPSVPTPSPTAPYQNVKGSGGVCDVDTDCPLIIELVDGQFTQYSQYCISGVCATNKVCTTNSDCQSIPGIPELDSCKMAGEDGETASPCRYTVGCSNGYCIRMGCKSTTDCGLNEVCSINQPTGNQIGVCLPLGNTCTNTTTGNSSQCWGGLFPCSAYSGINQNQAVTGYCTECTVGNDNTCNLSPNPNGGPGAYCQTISGFSSTIGNTGAPPAVCKTNDNFKYFDCPSGTVQGASLNGNTVCCSSSSSTNTCGKKCFDDYQCGDNCPYCVPVDGDISNRVCSCIKITPTQKGFNGAQSEYACQNGFGITYDYNTGSRTSNQINPNYHVCVASETADCAFSYDAVQNQLVGALGNITCFDLQSPYCELKTGKCKSTLEGAVCIEQQNGSTPCMEISSDGTITPSLEYACTLNRTCTKRNFLIAGENCIPPEEGEGLSCGEGLVCSLPMGPKGKRVCIPNGFAGVILDPIEDDAEGNNDGGDNDENGEVAGGIAVM